MTEDDIAHGAAASACRSVVQEVDRPNGGDIYRAGAAQSDNGSSAAEHCR
jgi:hypothetical protein